MTPVRLAALALLALALVAAAMWFGREGEPQSQSPGHGLLWPGLQGQIQRVERIGLRAAGDAVLETLERRDDDWLAMRHDGWWAEAGRVDAFLRELGRARKLEAKTAISEHHRLLGVEDIELADAAGMAVDITVAGDTRRLLVGHANPHSSGRFVRFAGEARAWLVDADLELPADPRQWLERDLVDIASRRVARLELTPSRGRVVSVVRTPGQGAGHALADVPADGRVDVDRVETAVTLFEGLRLDEVRRDTGIEAAASGDAVRIDMRTLDGLVLVADSWREGAVRWVRFRVAFDEAVARGWVAAEIERDRVALEAASRAPVSGGDEAAAPLDPQSTGIGPLDAAERLAILDAEAAALASRLEGWAFSFPPRKQAIIETPIDDYLTPAG